MTITYSEAFERWNADIKPAVIQHYGTDDWVALSESWNDYSDSLCKEGEFTQLQYHHCPAWDGEMPDEDGEFILEAMGVTFSNLRIPERPDGLMQDMPSGATHYRVLIKRGSLDMSIYYSMGPAHKSPPSASDVMNSLLIDTSDVEGIDFEEWAENIGFDPDSRKAERAFKQCQETLLQLRQLFSESELEDLREVFADY